MTKTRLEAFSDGVIAIIITIMVLELKVPHEATVNALARLLPIFLCYLLSFINVAIYWGNHHHLLHTVTKVSSSILWANMHLLFWLSLIPFTTGWMGENHFETYPVAVYGINLLLCGFAYSILQQTISKHNKFDSKLAVAMKKQEYKGYVSLVGYSLALPAAFYNSTISAVIFVAIAIMWLVPDKNIEKALMD
jgi:uncharacterized membrane protein